MRDLRSELRGEILGSDSYVPIFVSTLLIVILIPISEGNTILQVLLTVLAIGTLLLTMHRSHLRAGTFRKLSVVGLIGGFLAVASQVGYHFEKTNSWISASTSVTFAFLIALAIPAILRRVLLARKVTMNLLAGALAAYLMLGLLFASAYRAMSLLNTETQFFAQTAAPTGSDFEYFSFITISTVGYGDLTPGNDLARAGAVAEAIMGQVFLVTIVARVVSNLGTERIPVQQVTQRVPLPPPAVETESEEGDATPPVARPGADSPG